MPLVTSTTSAPGIFTKEALHEGKPVPVRCLAIDGRTYAIRPGPARILALEDEWYDDVADPHAVIGMGARDALPADLFTFWQRVPDVAPRFPFHLEWEELAVVEIASYDEWWKRKLKSRVRNHVRHAQKQGVVVDRVAFDDAFVRGMTAIFNETPIRQGRSFWHYGKDFATVKRQFSRFVFREHMIAAHHDGEMIGFVMLGNAGRFGVTLQILSSIRHRDKLTNYALMAKTIEVCEAEGLRHLVYGYWSDDSLSEFKRRCGFERMRVPRYYVPLTSRGRIALRCKAHRGFKAMLPPALQRPLKRARRLWLERIHREAS
jgi:hypothetical protein